MVTISPTIIEAAQFAEQQTNVPASVTLAQYGLESGWGSKITGTFNYFGIKAVPSQSFTTCATHEYVNGVIKPFNQNFANYDSVNDAFLAHAKLLSTDLVYDNFMLAVSINNIKDACTALTGVYATDPNYGNLLWEIIQGDNLQQYDKK